MSECGKFLWDIHRRVWDAFAVAFVGCVFIQFAPADIAWAGWLFVAIAVSGAICKGYVAHAEDADAALRQPEEKS